MKEIINITKNVVVVVGFTAATAVFKKALKLQ